MNLYTFNPELGSNYMGQEQNDPNQLENQDPQDPYSSYNNLDETCLPMNEYHQLNINDPTQLGLHLNNEEIIEVPDIPDTCFNYITNILREHGSDDRPNNTLQDYMDAQVSYNKSLDSALLGDTCTFLTGHCPPPVCENASKNFCDQMGNINNTHFGKAVFGGVGGSCSDFGSGFGRNVGLGSGGGLVPAPLLAAGGGCLSHQDMQGFDFSTDVNWGSSFGFGSGSGSGCGSNLLLNRKSNQFNEGVGVEQSEVEYLSDAYPFDMNMCSNAQLDHVLRMSHAGIMPLNCPNGSNEDGNARMPIDMNDGAAQEFDQCVGTVDKPRGRRHVEADGIEIRDETGRSSKHAAPSSEVFEQIEKYGDVLLCPEGRNKPAGLCSTLKTNSLNSDAQTSHMGGGGTSSKGSKKRGHNVSLVIDLKNLLTRCAQCVAKVDLVGAYELLNQIKQHSSPYGDYLQRVAHYLANGLEARLEGKGWELTCTNELVPPCEILKANRIYVASVPFKIMSYYTTNKTIAKLVEEVPSIHIIDFGIFYGLQWPCIIQNLSKRPNGPPKIRITGIDFPQHGFRPAQRVEETGRCLAKYCEMYNVPFEYHAIAKKWETIQLEDLRIDRNEPIVVNCLYRSHNLYDESVEEHSPRDAFLTLVRSVNPDIFMHGVVNSMSNVPFFLNRFKEAMFHYTALFDMFEATMSREDNERFLLESKLYGNQAMNVIACEGVERVERPESYKQWQVRTQRAGFAKVPLERELLKRARAMVRRNFRPEFSYDEDGDWVVQGWKGRILYAISCWKPQQV